MPISNTSRFQDLKQLTLLNEHEKNNIKGGYLFSCEEKKRNLMKLFVYSDAGVLIDTINGITATEAGNIMINYRPTTFSLATFRTV